jgi:hypothetical protein
MSSLARPEKHLVTGPASSFGTGQGVREGKAMIATLRHRLLCIPARLIHHAGQLILRLPPDHQLLIEVLTRLRTLPAIP